METSQKLMSSKEADWQILPGIPNEITLDQIVPKLSWRNFYILSSVSCAWRQAIQSYQVQDARIRAKSRETLVLFNCRARARTSCSNSIVLYSMREKRCYKLPPIPYLCGRIPCYCACVSLNGKIYILGGEKKPTSLVGSDEVYVLDIAGQRHWKRCASMRQPRLKFGAGVMDGKIYVFGGTTPYEPPCESEVYDPNLDAWFPIKHTSFWRHNHSVSTTGDEFFIYAGETYDFVTSQDGPVVYHVRSASDVDVYNPAKDEWRTIENPFEGRNLVGVFMVQGKFYLVTESGIYAHDIDRRSWTLLHVCSFAVLGPSRFLMVMPLTGMVVGDELVLLVDWTNIRDQTS